MLKDRATYETLLRALQSERESNRGRHYSCPAMYFDLIDPDFDTLDPRELRSFEVRAHG